METVESARILVISILLICFGSQVRSEASVHRYKIGDPIPFYAEKVGPYQNPSESYAYFDLPFCSSDNVKEKKLDLSEMLNGYRLVYAPYKIEFLVNRTSEVLCRKRLMIEEVSLFRSVLAKDYYMQMYFDELPTWSFLGMVDRQEVDDRSKDKYFLFNHLHFIIYYNKDRVIQINVMSLADKLSLPEVTDDKEVDIEFLYTVVWEETNSTFNKRMEKYTTPSLSPQQITRWFAILNSCWTSVILISCLLIFYWRVLRKDILKYAHDEELADNQEESGWKYIHGDVFRFPTHKSLFAAALGSGTHLLTLMLLIIILGLVGVFRPYARGLLFNAIVIVYAITSGISGYTAVSFYQQLEGTNWMRNLLLTGGLFTGPLFLTFCFLNTVATAYRVTTALPLGAIVAISFLWAFLSSPLLLLGGFVGKSSRSEFQAPCHTSKCPREIPRLRWYRGILPQMALAGFLPFSVINIELQYIMSTAWGHRFDTIYSILSIVFIILLIETALVSVAFTYFQLAAEDHEWWWRSFLRSGSTGLYIFAYCFHYYFALSDMTGFIQASFFFGYMACICYGIFLMLGTLGFCASLLFVRYLYGSIKCE